MGLFTKWRNKEELTSARMNRMLDEIESKLNELNQALNSKANNDSSTYCFRGVTNNFDTALKTGWYQFLNHDNQGYGVLKVQNHSNVEHNGQSTWIWQEKWTTAGTRQWRYAVNNGGWSDWRNE